MEIEVFQAGFDAHRMRRPRSACSHPEDSAEYSTWVAGWDTRQSYVATDPLVSQIFVDTIGDILRDAFGSAPKEPISLEMMMLLLELGVAAQYKNNGKD